MTVDTVSLEKSAEKDTSKLFVSNQNVTKTVKEDTQSFVNLSQSADFRKKAFVLLNMLVLLVKKKKVKHSNLN